MIAAGFSRSSTSAICGAANAVLRYRMSAPSLATATVASTNPRWLRHISATPSPSLTPSPERASASALVRRSMSPKVSDPRSSMRPISSGSRAASAW
jgi:hypothetical protein